MRRTHTSNELRARKHMQRISLFALALAAFGGAGAAWAQAPVSLDDQLRDQLALGDSLGCVDFLGVTQAEISSNSNGAQGAVADKLVVWGGQIGNELRAICGPSAVSSASSLGGGLSDFQATKTVSQFRLARRRIDTRLRRGGRRADDWSGVQLAFAGATSDMAALSAPGSPPPQGWSVFGELEGESREREQTRFEDGYDADAYSATIGLDFAWSRFVAGGWLSYSDMEGDSTARGALISPAPATPTILSDPATLAAICGGTAGGGDFSNEAIALGAFWGMRFGETAFADVTVSYTDREYDYTRNLCSIELPSTTNIAFTGGVLTANSVIADDIFAGAISGAPNIMEYGVALRGGFDLPAGAWMIGPRAALSYTRSEIDAYTETGKSTVANTVDPVFGADVLRTLGGATGFELSYEDQTRDSLLLELGAEVSRPIDMAWGVLVPHGSVTLRHEFEDDRDLVTVRMAQDLRGAGATRFAFATDAPDADDIVLSAGITALVGQKMAADIEITHLAANDLYESTAVSAQFRVRF